MVVFQANPSNDRFRFRVINMTIVPGKEIFNPVHGSHSDMEGITDGLSGDCSSLNKRFREQDDLFGHRKKGYSG